MKRLLWVGDAGCNSGFGKASRQILEHLAKIYEVWVVGSNYISDPHNEPYHIWPAYMGGDPVGFGQLKRVFPKVNPDVVVLQANPWNIPRFLDAMGSSAPRPPTIGIIAVEGKNIRGTDLNKLSRAIFWTEFGRNEAVNGGCKVPTGIAPLGVDLDLYKPGDKLEARQALGLPEESFDAFIVGNINRNQYRKRLDLTVQHFAEWYHRNNRPNAYVYVHCLPGASVQVDVEQLAKYYGVPDRLIFPLFKDFFQGVIDEWVVKTYQSFDVGLNSGHGEGWGLTTMEGMACGIPQIATDCAAVPEWAGHAVRLVSVSSWGLMPDVNTMIGGTPDTEGSIAAINDFYVNPTYRDEMTKRALACVSQPHFRWENIAARFAEEIEAGI